MKHLMKCSKLLEVRQLCAELRINGTEVKRRREKVRTNQSDLKSSLQDLRDTEKYLKLIESVIVRLKKRRKNPKEGI